MVKVQVIKTGEIREVTPNIAHGLIDEGKAKLVKNYKTKPLMPTSTYDPEAGLRSRSRNRKKSGYLVK